MAIFYILVRLLTGYLPRRKEDDEATIKNGKLYILSSSRAVIFSEPLSVILYSE